MSPDQFVFIALLVPALFGAPYMTRVFSSMERSAPAGAGVGALSGLGGAFIALQLIDFCTFQAESSNLEMYMGFFFAAVGGAVAVVAVQWMSLTFLQRGKPISLGGQRTSGMFNGWTAPWVLLFPSLVILLMFLYYPAIQTMRMSFFNTRLGRTERFICVDNFNRLLNADGFNWQTLAVFVVIMFGFFLVRFLSREDGLGMALQAGAAVLIAGYVVMNFGPVVILLCAILAVAILIGRDRELTVEWLSYGVMLVLALLFFQEVLGEILSRTSTNNYYRVVSNTFFMSGVIVVASLVLSLAIAYVAYQPIRGGNFYRTLLIWPYAISPPVAGIIFDLLFQPEAGLVNHMLDLSGFGAVAWKSAQFAPWTIIVASVWKSLGFCILFYIAGLQNVPRDLTEAAAIDGANAWQRFMRITVPMLSPITFFLIITTITYAFFDIFGTIDYLTSGGPAGATTVMIYAIYDTFDPHLGRAAAQSVILFFLVIAITYVQFRTTGRRVNYGGL